MFKKLTILSLLLLLLLPIKTDAEIAILLDLKDSSNHNATCIVREGGDYFFSMGIGGARAEGSGNLTQRGCMAVMEDTTANWRIVVVGNSCNGTGKAVLYYFGVGVFTILDQTSNGQD